jgi:hypothetical protein
VFIVLQETSFVRNTRKHTEILRRISINSSLLASEYTVSGNRVFGGKIYGVWEQGVGENVKWLGTGCLWGECMVSRNREFGRMYSGWEQGVCGENVWCLGTGSWGECIVAGNRVFGGKIYGVWDRVSGRMYAAWEQGAGENIWCLGTGCSGEYMVSGNRVFGDLRGRK